jgi:hypothetical protein
VLNQSNKFNTQFFEVLKEFSFLEKVDKPLACAPIDAYGHIVYYHESQPSVFKKLDYKTGIASS